MGREGRGDRRGTFALACALGIHAALVGWMGARKTASPTVVTSREGEETLEVEWPTADAPDDEASPSTPAVEKPLDRAGGTRAPMRGRELASTVPAPNPSVERAGARGPASSRAVPGEAPAESRDAWTFNPTRTELALGPTGPRQGLDAQRAAAIGGEATNARGGYSTTGGLLEALDAHDASAGLGRGGPVRGAVEEVVQGAEVMGVARFEVSIEGSGDVRVRLDEVSADALAWTRLADAIREAVSRKRGQIRLPPSGRHGGGGLSVVVQVEAKERLPDGRSPATKGTHLEGTSGHITEQANRVDVALPSATLAHEGKVCAAGLHAGLDGVALVGGCDPENLGMKATRRVAARVIRETRL